MTLWMLTATGEEWRFEAPGLILLEQEKVDIADAILRALEDNGIDILDHVWKQGDKQ